MLLLAYILVTLFQLFLAFYVTYLAVAFVTGGPFVPSSMKAARAMVSVAKIKPDDRVYDFGSGDGRLLMLAAEKGAIAVGFEINPFLVAYTNIRAFFSPYRGRVCAYWKNFWRAKVTDADVVFVYLLPWKMDKLQKLLETQLHTGAIIVSNSFIFRSWRVTQHDTDAHVYVFQIPSYKQVSDRRISKK